MPNDKPSNYWRQANSLLAMSIEQNKTLPESAKEDLKRLVTAQMMAIAQTIGTYELLYLREKATDPIDERVDVDAELRRDLKTIRKMAESEPQWQGYPLYEFSSRVDGTKCWIHPIQEIDPARFFYNLVPGFDEVKGRRLYEIQKIFFK